MECHKWIFFITPKNLENQLWPVSAYDNSKGLVYSTGGADTSRCRALAPSTPSGPARPDCQGTTTGALERPRPRTYGGGTPSTPTTAWTREGSALQTTRAPTRDNYGRLARRERSDPSSHRGRLQLPARRCVLNEVTQPRHAVLTGTVPRIELDCFCYLIKSEQ